MESAESQMTGDFYMDYSACIFQYLQQPESHDRDKKGKLHEEVLNHCLPELERNLDFHDVIDAIDRIKMKELFDSAITHNIMEQRTKSGKTVELIKHIQKRDRHTYEQFKECLVKSGQTYLKSILERTETKIKGQHVHCTEYIYAIGDSGIEEVAQTIMCGLKEGFSFKKEDWDTLENEKTNENSDIDCLILFESATLFSSRSEDRIKARREKQPKVRNIIIVCISKDRDGHHSRNCSETPFLMDQDIVFKYHIKADNSPHDCSRDVVGRIRLHLIIIKMGASYQAQLLKSMDPETERESEKQHINKLQKDLEDKTKQNEKLEKDNKKLQMELQEAYHMCDQLREDYHKLKDQTTTDFASPRRDEGK